MFRPRALAAFAAAWLCFAGDAGANPQAVDVSVPFIANAGQQPANVRFQASTFAGGAFVMDDGALTYTFSKPAAARGESAVVALVRESFVGGRAVPRPGEKSPTNVSFLQGEVAHHHAQVATYSNVRLGEVFPGVDVQLRATGRNVEKIFTIAPGRDPSAIRVAIGGARRLEVAGDGALIVGTELGDVSFTPPVAFQKIGDKEVPVKVAYALDAAGHRYGFTLGDYDASLPLVIDPLLQTTFLGGNGNDTLTAIVLHPSSGEVYVFGETGSNNLSCVTPATPGCGNGAQNGPPGNTDCFVSRLNASLTSLLQTTYFGGNLLDRCNALAIAPDGLSVYIAGSTYSKTPPVGGGAQSTHTALAETGYVARLTANLQSLLAFSYYGGPTAEAVAALAVHPGTGDVFIGGAGLSSTGLLGINAGSFDQTLSGPLDGFLARFTPNLNSVVQATYLGGSSDRDYVTAIAFHPINGDLYVAGSTSSADFPNTTKGAVPFSGIGAAYIARMSPDLGTLRQATFFGGTDATSGTSGLAMALHPATGDVYLGGSTTAAALHGVSSGAQSVHAGNPNFEDGFVARFDATLTTLFRSTFIGGTAIDEVGSLAIHPVSGEIIAAGYTSSSDLPGISNSVQGTLSGPSDGYVARFSPNLFRLVTTTYFGGTAEDSINDIAISPVSGNVYVAGYAMSATLAGTTNAPQPAHAADTSQNDGFIAMMSGDLNFSDTTPNAFSFASKTGVPLATYIISDPVQITGINDPADIYTGGSLNNGYCISNANSCSCDQTGGVFVNTPGTVVNSRYVCVRHLSSAANNQVTSTTLFVGARSATFYASTGSPLGSNCTLDVDGNSKIDALSDGLMLIRAMFGLTGTSVTNNAVGLGASRNTWALLQPWLNGNCGSSFAP
jgi:hypothetical protein